MIETLYFAFQSLIYLLIMVGLVNILFSFVTAAFYPLKERLRLRKLYSEGIDPFAYTPTISVIVPAWNEEVGILKTINSLLLNNYPKLEIVVVNDGSKDNTSARVNDFIKKGIKQKRFNQSTITFIDNKINQGKGHALNDGIKVAKGDIILTMDADSALEIDGLKNMVKYFAGPKVMGFVGNVVVANNNSYVGQVQRLEYLFGFYLKRAHAVLGCEYIFGGACAAYRKEVFEQIGYFDTENKTEDIEMSMRSRLNGMDCAYGEDVIAYTEGAATTVSLINQRVRWKKGRFDTFKRYANLFFSTDQKHNGFLGFYILPLAMLGEFLLFVSPLALSFMIFYSVITVDYITLAFNILFLSLFYFTACLFTGKLKIGVLLSFPFTWTLFFYLVLVEFVAQMKSIYLITRKQQVVWQSWARRGISEISTNTK